MRIRTKTDLFAWILIVAVIAAAGVLASAAWSAATKLFRLIAG